MVHLVKFIFILLIILLCISIIKGSGKLLYIFRIRKNSEFTSGEIIDVIELKYFSNNHSSKPKIMVYPIVQYIVNGIVYKEKYISYRYRGNSEFKIGQQVSVQYNYSKCSEYIIAGDNKIESTIITSTAFSVILIAVFITAICIIK